MKRIHRSPLAALAASALVLSLATACSGTGAQSAGDGSSDTGSASSTLDTSSASSSSDSGTQSTTGGTGSDSLTPSQYVHSAEFVPGMPLLDFPGDPGVSQLVADMEAGKVPSSCNVLFDQMGGLPDVEVTDPETVTAIYELVKGLTVEGPSNMSITDSYHHVIFTLQDGSKVGFQFEGAGNLVGEETNLVVLGDGPLWTFVRQLQNAQMGSQESRAGGFHKLFVIEDAEAVHGLPEEAAAGETVSFTVDDFTDVDLKVYLVSYLGSEEIHRSGATYSFAMPDADVQIHLVFRDYPGGGA